MVGEERELEMVDPSTARLTHPRGIRGRVFSGNRYRAAMPDDHAELPPVDRAAFADRYGPRALVAGGASGIGAEYCRQIAATGIDLVILDRDEPGLDATASELR